MKAADCKIGKVVFQKYSGYAICITAITPPYMVGQISDGHFHESDICKNRAEAIVR